MIKTKESRKYLKNLQGCYAYSYVDTDGEPVDLNIVTDTYLDDDGFVCGITYCQIPDVDRNGKFSAFNTYRDTIDEHGENGSDIIIYTKEEVGEIIKTLQHIYDGYAEVSELKSCEVEQIGRVE